MCLDRRQVAKREEGSGGRAFKNTHPTIKRSTMRGSPLLSWEGFLSGVGRGMSNRRRCWCVSMHAAEGPTVERNAQQVSWTSV